MADFFLGLDFGTSGARACVLNERAERVIDSRQEYSDPTDPSQWREALLLLINELPLDIRLNLAALAIDGTSGTLLATDSEFEPVSPALLYNDGSAAEEAREIANPQYGPTSGLAKRLWLTRRFPDAAYCFHQSDWLTALLTGKGGISDYHNALKSGFDVEQMRWPEWVGRLPGAHYQQKVLEPGTTIDKMHYSVARRLGVNPECLVRAGTTDSIAAFIASGASRPGEAVTSLGTTLVLKLLSERPVNDAASGVYSHRYGSLWLAGGASNSGGGVLKKYFDDDELISLSAAIDPTQDTGLDYYPLPCPGERFPANNPRMPPRMEPRPGNDAHFLHGLLEGMARIELQGYRKLVELGATPLKSVMTAGGGAKNGTWRCIRERMLQVPVTVASHVEAAYGAARLACLGPRTLPGSG